MDWKGRQYKMTWETRQTPTVGHKVLARCTHCDGTGRLMDSHDVGGAALVKPTRPAFVRAIDSVVHGENCALVAASDEAVRR